jgi:site-specific recombinase XerD
MHHGVSQWCHGDPSPGWLFASRSKSDHIQSISGSFTAARDRAGLDLRPVPYCARHTFRTYAMAETGNLFAVSKSIGHADLKSVEPYQHQDTTRLAVSINRRNSRTSMRITDLVTLFGHTQPVPERNTAHTWRM